MPVLECIGIVRRYGAMMCNARCGKVVVAETMHLLLQAAKPAAPSQLVARTFGTTQRAYTDFSLFQTVFIHLTYLILLDWLHVENLGKEGCIARDALDALHCNSAGQSQVASSLFS